MASIAASDTANTQAPLSQLDQELILQLRLLIARAGQTDSLNWWEDNSLASGGEFVLNRLFPIAPSLAGRSLALRAAQKRHAAALNGLPRAMTLYRLDNDGLARLSLERSSLLAIDVPIDPITNIETLYNYLRVLLVEEPVFSIEAELSDNRMQIALPDCPLNMSPIVQRAFALAWAYLQAQSGQPVFPFLLE